MLAELRRKSQATIPAEIVSMLGLSEGDKLEIFVKDGSICLMPVTVYPQEYLAELRKEVDETKAQLVSGELPVFDNADDMFQSLEAQ